MQGKNQKQQLIFAIYWFMLAYVVAALVWWFIALTIQNKATSDFRIADLPLDHPQYAQEVKRIESFRERKFTQYVGEGVTFLLIIMGAAIFIYRAVRRQFNQSRNQQNFMMAITHELKTPIAVAQLNLETLNKHKLDEAQREKLSNNTLQEIKRLNALCNDLLVSSQLEQGGYVYSNEEFDLSALLLEITNSFANRFPLRSFELHSPDRILFSGDQQLLEMALNNIVENAVKYSKDAVHVTAVEYPGGVKIKVADSGQGIADEEKKNIFNKFYRVGNETTRSAKGTGLGLFIARRIVIAHKGKISVENNSPVGSIFTIELPVKSKP